MKRFLVLAILVIIAAAPLFSVTTGDTVDHVMIGYVRQSLNFSVSLLNNVLPFDLDGPDVAYNTSATIINGLRVATFTLVSNNYNFTLYITHDKLTLRTNEGGTKPSIDYRLYAVVNENTQEYLSSRSAANAESPKTVPAESRITITGSKTNTYFLVNNSMFVSLDEGSASATQSVLDNLPGGFYESNIYLVLVGGL